MRPKASSTILYPVVLSLCFIPESVFYTQSVVRSLCILTACTDDFWPYTTDGSPDGKHGKTKDTVRIVLGLTRQKKTDHLDHDTTFRKIKRQVLFRPALQTPKLGMAFTGRNTSIIPIIDQNR